MMVNITFRNRSLFYITVFCAMILTILPLPQWAAWCRPQWVFLTLAFWFIFSPQQAGPGTAFVSGVLVDLLLGTTLGQHALVFVVFCYVLARYSRALQVVPLWQQIVGVSVLSLMNLLLQWAVMRLGGVVIMHWQFWLPVLSNMVIWPWLSLLLKECQPKAALDVVS